MKTVRYLWLPGLSGELRLAYFRAPGKVLAGAQNPIFQWLPKLGRNRDCEGRGEINVLVRGCNPRWG